MSFSFLDFSVGVETFVKGLSQISSFFSKSIYLRPIYHLRFPSQIINYNLIFVKI